MQDLSTVEVPRLVKKPGQHKRVETHAELKSALADGWVLRLGQPASDPAHDDLPPQGSPEESVEGPDQGEPAVAPVGTSWDTYEANYDPNKPDFVAEQAKRKPGRPPGSGGKKK